MADVFLNSVADLGILSKPQAALLAAELDINSWGEMLSHFPFRYDDRSVFYTVAELHPDMATAQLRVVISSKEIIPTGKIRRLVAQALDERGRAIQLVWFNSLTYWFKWLPIGQSVVVYGKPTLFRTSFSIVHPEVTILDPLLPAEQVQSSLKPLTPVYSLTEKLKKKGIDSLLLSKVAERILELVQEALPENLPQTIVQEQQLMPRWQAYQQLHFPDNYELHARATERLKFEELFYNQLKLLKVRGLRKTRLAGLAVKHLDRFTQFYENHLPFTLTEAQKRVLREVRRDMGSGHQMNRLVQGDVGSGKTIVAFMAMLMALDGGAQACLMAPTEILAEQHYNGLKPLAAAIGLPIAKLTGSTKTKERKPILEALASGVLPIVVGTHALLEPTVRFQKLGLSVVDEQHRFGVAQRARLWQKNVQEDGTAIAPHILVMTATPIPRTLAMTLYGDLDVSVIDELPPGRKPIKTSHVYQNQRLQVWNFMWQQIQEGRQIYVVYPLIEENEKLDLVALEQGYALLQEHFEPKGISLSMVHGRQNKEERDAQMQQFLQGKTQIMVATTVIEVGVNVPNASVMLIENAERFGLSQLHQLRGRVGRGADQSFCILMTDHKLSQDSKTRLSTMVRTNNGFEIAETDLNLRGPGDMLGTQQSGSLQFKIANIAEDMGVLTVARELATTILEEDPELQQPEHQCMATYLAQEAESGLAWSRIS